MDFNPDTIRFLQTVSATCIGAMTAGFLSYNSTRIHYRRSMRDKAAEDDRLEHALLDIFQYDLRTLAKLHAQMSTLLTSLGENQPLDWIVPVQMNYMSIFENNVGNLGRLRHPEVVSQIIETYHLAKSLIDSLRSNNEMVHDYRKWTIDYENSANEVSKRQAERLRDRMINYAQVLRVSSSSWLSQIEKTQKTIADYRALSGK